MLTAYFDDSGTHQGALVTAVGGCIARVEQWKAFEDAWRKALDEQHVESFHANKLESRLGEFKGWGEDRKRQFIRTLAGIMKAYAKTAVAGLVVAADYVAVVPQWAKDSATFGDNYNFCFQMCVGQTMDWIAGLNPPMPSGAQIKFTFDQQGNLQGRIRRDYELIKRFRDPDGRMGPLDFGQRLTAVPLQAADFIAYEAYKHLNNVVSHSNRPMRGSLRILVESVYEFRAHYFDKENLKSLIDHYQSTRRNEHDEPWWPWHKDREAYSQRGQETSL